MLGQSHRRCNVLTNFCICWNNEKVGDCIVVHDCVYYIFEIEFNLQVGTKFQFIEQLLLYAVPRIPDCCYRLVLTGMKHAGDKPDTTSVIMSTICTLGKQGLIQAQ